MKTGYLDAFSGLSGDMIVGALIDAGADFAAFERALSTLALDGYRLSTKRKTVSGISALKFEVEILKPQSERHLGEIRAMIEAAAGLSAPVQQGAIKIFEVLAEAEAKVHQTTADRVHFHEVGAVDSIIDVVAAAWGIDQLSITNLFVSPLPGGSGMVRSRHGLIPVPAPATVELLAGFPVRIGDGAGEMVTPTGAAVLKALARPAPALMTFESDRVGYGAGTRDLTDRPNVLRLLIGHTRSLEYDELVEVAANIDDLNPQIYDHLTERLLEVGARDVTITPTIMKKGRPGVVLSVLVAAAVREAVAGVIFAETSTIGIRFHPVARIKLPRRMIEVQTRWGTIRVKVAGADGAAATVSPEFEDCRRAALEFNVALRHVIEEAHAAARRVLC